MLCACGYAHNTETSTACKLCGDPWPPAGAHGEAAPEPARRAPAINQDRSHVLVVPGGQPLRLIPGKDLLIGRAPTCGMRIPSKRVSREHARVEWRSGFPVLVNLSEQNGTLVNGRGIQDHELRHRDEITIGPLTIGYQMVKGDARPEEDVVTTTMVDEAETLSGSLERMNMFELLRSFEAQRRSGTLLLRSSGREGEIVLEKGRFASASVEEQDGEAAIVEMLGWKDGSFSFTTERRTKPLKLIRKFDYSGSAPVPERDRLAQTTISELLGRAASQQLSFLDEDDAPGS